MALPSHLNVRPHLWATAIPHPVVAQALCLGYRHLLQQATCQFGRRAELALAPILHGDGGRGVLDEIDVISGLSEPYGPDRTMAKGGGIGPEIPQPRSAGPLRQAVRAA